MKIGNLYIGQHVDRAVRAHLLSPDGRELVARMARSEVKNYLAELAEEAEMPFPSPEGFLREIVTLPNGHTTTCTCPDKETS